MQVDSKARVLCNVLVPAIQQSFNVRSSKYLTVVVSVQAKLGIERKAHHAMVIGGVDLKGRCGIAS